MNIANVSTVDVKASEVVGQIKITVRLVGLWKYQVRFSLAILLLRLARVVSGLDMEIDTDGAQKASD